VFVKLLLTLLSFVSLVALAAPGDEFSTFKPELSESQVHPDKKISRFVKSLEDGGSCDPVALREARELIRNCRGQGPGRINRAECISGMKTFFGKRGSTSSTQDIEDAVKYCAKRYTSVFCATTTYDFAKKRGSSTNDQDISEAANFCNDRGDPNCLVPTYTELRRRSGTTGEEDLNDTLKICSN
jgi:hypothetical protein